MIYLIEHVLAQKNLLKEMIYERECMMENMLNADGDDVDIHHYSQQSFTKFILENKLKELDNVEL
jgi:hypothetical protein